MIGIYEWLVILVADGKDAHLPESPPGGRESFHPRHADGAKEDGRQQGEGQQEQVHHREQTIHRTPQKAIGWKKFEEKIAHHLFLGGKCANRVGARQVWNPGFSRG